MLVLIVAACTGLRALNVGSEPERVPPDPEPPPTDGTTPPEAPEAVPEHRPPDAPTVAHDPCDDDVPDPGRPAVPKLAEVLTVTVRTGATTNAGTDDATLSLCLGAACFPLDPGSGDQLRTGSVGVWTFEGLALARAAAVPVELRVVDGSDGWDPVAMDLRLDGEPVYCASLAGLEIGTDSGEVARWTDPNGLHQDCTSAWDDRTLTHGPVVGAVGPDRARVWVRTDATRAVSVRVWPTADPHASRTGAWVYPRAEDGFAGVLDLDCLDPSTPYTYEVLVDGVPQGQHTFATAPPDGAPTTLRLAFGSCTGRPSQPIFGALDAHAPDLFAFVGDAHYADTSDLDSLRWEYRTSLEVPERAAFLARTPVLATWDDHDFLGEGTDGLDPGREQALRAFVEHWPNPSAGTVDTPGTFFATRWGDLDLFFLDGRYWRAVDGNLLGDAQHAWLEAELAAATGTFKLLVVGSQWTLEGDGWAAFPAERDDLLQHVADLGITGVVLLSGDAHRGELRSLPALSYALPEITSSPLADDTLAPCPTSPELLACASQDLWVTVAADTTLADPTLTATLHDVAGAELATHGWTLSQLTP